MSNSSKQQAARSCSGGAAAAGPLGRLYEALLAPLKACPQQLVLALLLPLVLLRLDAPLDVLSAPAAMRNMSASTAGWPPRAARRDAASHAAQAETAVPSRCAGRRDGPPHLLCLAACCSAWCCSRSFQASAFLAFILASCSPETERSRTGVSGSCEQAGPGPRHGVHAAAVKAAGPAAALCATARP